MELGYSPEYFQFSNAHKLQVWGFLIKEAIYFYPDPELRFPVSLRPAEARKEMAKVEAARAASAAGKG
jgi:hypothetical protein